MYSPHHPPHLASRTHALFSFMPKPSLFGNMRLINTHTLELKEFFGSDIPDKYPYAILSHTWEDEEVNLQEFTQLPRDELQKKKGFDKIRRTCKLALQSKIDWAWVDTCCIDKTSSAELTEAINSMYTWYAESTVCYAYLSDLESGPSEEEGSRLEKCRWFTRGWTLQELIAPKRLGFYDKDWKFQGQKSDLYGILTSITGISEGVLEDRAMLETVSVACRMSWASRRETTRIEDRAYCLLGIFGVQLPLLYGEGENAFVRLQEEIIKESNDYSLLAWRADSNLARTQKHWGVLARSPKEFSQCSDIELCGDPIHNSECAITSKGLRVTPVPRSGLRLPDDGSYVFNLQCKRRNKAENLGVFIQQHGCDVYTRIRPDELAVTLRSTQDKTRPFFISKTISLKQSTMLQRSLQGAINLSRALVTLHQCGAGLLKEAPGAFLPAGHWDLQRSLFLTCGIYRFPCCVRFKAGDQIFVLGCLLVGGPKDRNLTVKFYTTLGVGADFESLVYFHPNEGSDTLVMNSPGDRGPRSRLKRTRLTASVVQERVDGQQVFFVVIDAEKQDDGW